MDLLRQIMSHTVDPDYAVAAARGGRRSSRGRWMLAVALLLAGVLFAMAALQTSRAAPAAAKERSELIQRVRTAQSTQDSLHARIGATSSDIRRLRSDRLGTSTSDRNLRQQVNRLEPLVGQVAVTGPGVQIVVDDSTTVTGEQGRVLDIDLQQLTNGLWTAGAEAIAINGYRLTALTAIRGAGDAITVDYRSLTRPYRIVAIGDPRTLQSTFAETSGGRWWSGLHQNLGMRFDVTTDKSVTVPGTAGLRLRYAKEKK